MLKRPVRFQQIPFEAYKARLVERGMPEAMAHMMRAKDAGLDRTEPRTPQACTPTTFRQWCEDVLKPAVLG
ncbi:hypothetical protein [Arenibaculum pallidiluteum]|uniref:hypothetical protein n=1 Tax=Arenibaculum pallidiluteum TaxID=2812559 RepID=UPI001F3BE100|nr:hypothetical protein [Arenibaculum pallidiluteum]